MSEQEADVERVRDLKDRLEEQRRVCNLHGQDGRRDVARTDRDALTRVLDRLSASEARVAALEARRQLDRLWREGPCRLDPDHDGDHDPRSR